MVLQKKHILSCEDLNQIRHMLMDLSRHKKFNTTIQIDIISKIYIVNIDSKICESDSSIKTTNSIHQCKDKQRSKKDFNFFFVFGAVKFPVFRAIGSSFSGCCQGVVARVWANGNQKLPRIT